MKKIFICSMSLVLIISLTLSNSAFAAGKTLKIAMLLWRGENQKYRLVETFCATWCPYWRGPELLRNWESRCCHSRQTPERRGTPGYPCCAGQSTDTDDQHNHCASTTGPYSRRDAEGGGYYRVMRFACNLPGCVLTLVKGSRPGTPRRTYRT